MRKKKLICFLKQNIFFRSVLLKNQKFLFHYYSTFHPCWDFRVWNVNQIENVLHNIFQPDEIVIFLKMIDLKNSLQKFISLFIKYHVIYIVGYIYLGSILPYELLYKTEHKHSNVLYWVSFGKWIFIFTCLLSFVNLLFWFFLFTHRPIT